MPFTYAYLFIDMIPIWNGGEHYRNEDAEASLVTLQS